MPATTYQHLLSETLPKRIENDEQYDLIRRRFSELLAARRRTRLEESLMNLLGVLIEDCDRRDAMPPDNSTPAEILSFLLEHSGKKPGVLLPVFGQRSHVHEALTGTRKISAEQARKLAKIFSVKPGLFV
jgi:antitoxin component HigA of HigAB toxin-antitoxin module